jgi:hypothetical protein
MAAISKRFELCVYNFLSRHGVTGHNDTPFGRPIPSRSIGLGVGHPKGTFGVFIPWPGDDAKN